MIAQSLNLHLLGLTVDDESVERGFEEFAANMFGRHTPPATANPPTTTSKRPLLIVSSSLVGTVLTRHLQEKHGYTIRPSSSLDEGTIIAPGKATVATLVSQLAVVFCLAGLTNPAISP